MRKIFFVILPLIALLPVVANAAITESGEAYTLGSQEVIEENLYAAGATVQLSGRVNADASIAGGNVTITGDVLEDLMVAGGTVLLLGNVGEDLRAAGGNITVIGDVGGEIMAAGGMISIAPDSVITGDAFVSGGTVIIDGIINGDVEVYAEEVQVIGKIDGSLTGKMTKLTIKESAEIGGNLAYESPHEALIDAGAVVAGAVDFDKITMPQVAPPDVEGTVKNAKRAFASFMATMAILKYLATLIAGLILVLWFQKKSELLVNETMGSFGNNLLIGLAVMIAGPIAMLILLLTGLGSVLAILGFALLAVVCTIGGIFSGIVLGGWIRQMWSKSKKISGDWKSALLGITLISLAAAIPILGWLFKMVFVMAVVGTICRIKYMAAKS